MTHNVISQISPKVVMTSRYLRLVDSLPPSEQLLWFSHQNVQDPNTWTMSHLIQFKHEYNNLENTSLHMTLTHNQERPQSGESLNIFLDVSLNLFCHCLHCKMYLHAF